MTAPTPEELRELANDWEEGIQQAWGQRSVFALGGQLHDALLAAADEIERLRDDWAAGVYRRERDEAREERDRLRAELAEACELLEGADVPCVWKPSPAINEYEPDQAWRQRVTALLARVRGR